MPVLPAIDSSADPQLGVHPSYARLLCMVLRGMGVDVEAVLQACDLRWCELEVRERMLDVETVRRLGLIGLRATGRPWLGLDLGQALQPSAHGPVGYAMLAAKDLRRAIETLVRFGMLRFEAIGFDLLPCAGGAQLRMVERVDLGEVNYVVADAVAVVVLKVVEALAPGGSARVAVDLPRPRPAWAERYDRLGVAQIRFGAHHLRMRLSDDLLASPNMTADAKDFSAAVAECERVSTAAPRQTAAAFTSRVQELLGRGMDHYPSLIEMAATLELSPRTLMRRLKSEGSSFQNLLDQTRQERALWYLQHSTLAVEDIAARLGYLDTSNFSRTFRRWFGMAPGAMRAASGERVKAP